MWAGEQAKYGSVPFEMDPLCVGQGAPEKKCNPFTVRAKENCVFKCYCCNRRTGGRGDFLMSGIRVCATDQGRLLISKNPEQAPISEVLLQLLS